MWKVNREKRNKKKEIGKENSDKGMGVKQFQCLGA